VSFWIAATSARQAEPAAGADPEPSRAD